MSGIALNEDDSHFYFTRNVEQMTVEGLKEMVDNYTSPQMKELVFNPCAQRVSYATKVWTPYWAGFDPKVGVDQPMINKHFGTDPDTTIADREGMHRLLLNTWTLNEKGIDPYAVWLKYTREKGMSPWLSMRMNDVHDAHNLNSVLHGEFWLAHPELWCVDYRMEGWNDRALDYGKKPVRDYMMSLVKELLERYDADGLELDWMRFGVHFPPGHEEAGRSILTEFMGEVRREADAWEKNRGHRIKIGVRVPTRPWTARDMGMDAIEWAKKRLVDMIVVTPFFTTNEVDIPIELWKELLGDWPGVLAAGQEIMIRPFDAAWTSGRMTSSPETGRGAAVSALDRGADRIYLFNYMDAGNCTLEMQEFKESDRKVLLSQIGELETATKYTRRHVVTFVETQAPGEPVIQRLPLECRKDRTATLRIHIGPKPTSGKAYVFFGIGAEERSEGEQFEVRVNGALCTFVPGLVPGPVHPIAKQVLGVGSPLGGMNRGFYVVEVMSKVHKTHSLVWAEIKIVP